MRRLPPAQDDALTLARVAVAAAADKKGADIVLLDLRLVSNVADYFVICTGTVDRQLDAIAGNIQDVLKKNHARNARRVEGQGDTGWILLDYGDLVVHLFVPSLRKFYDLEDLWSNAPVLLRMQ